MGQIMNHHGNWKMLHYQILGSPRNSLVVQWLRLCTFTAKGPGSIPGQGTKIPQAVWSSQKKKKPGKCN